LSRCLSTEIQLKENSIETRIDKSLARLGFPNLNVMMDSHGMAELTGAVRDVNDRSLITAIVRTTPGVTGVKNLVKVES
tara:strand:- start:35761 stop:35997 length:237 start_codon:yes stop_codon:yes gene_type:complete